MLLQKNEVRREVRTRKKLLDEDTKIAAARRVFQRVKSLPQFIEAERILLYHALPDELPTQELLAEIWMTKQIFLPRVNGDDIEILPYAPERMRIGAFNIEEPGGDDIVDAADIDLIVVPGVAFDRLCNRVGRGKGYYDRLLCRTNATTVGVCYDFQLYDQFLIDAHDIPVDVVIADLQAPIYVKKC